MTSITPPYIHKSVVKAQLETGLCMSVGCSTAPESQDQEWIFHSINVPCGLFHKMATMHKPAFNILAIFLLDLLVLTYLHTVEIFLQLFVFTFPTFFTKQ